MVAASQTRPLRRRRPNAPTEAAVNAFSAYLDAVENEQGRFIEVRANPAHALNRLAPGGPKESLITVANELRQARDAFKELAVRMSGIEPPAELADAHAALAKSLQLFGQTANQIQSDLRPKHVTVSSQTGRDA